MKKLLLLLLLSIEYLLPTCTIAQEIKQIQEIERIVEVNLNKSALFANAQQWASFNDPACKKNIEVQDNENGSLVVNFEVYENTRNNSLTKHLVYIFRFSVKIDCKDNKYRRVILNPSVYVGYASNSSIYEKFNESILFEINHEIQIVAIITDSYFQKLNNWELGKVSTVIETNENEIKFLNDCLTSNGNPKYDKKEKKQIEIKLKQFYDASLVLKESQMRWAVVVDRITKSIDKLLTTNNDF